MTTKGFSFDKETRTIEVLRKKVEKDSILLYGSDLEYHIIANPKAKVEVGDLVEYQPYGVNFGWFIKVMKEA